MLRVRRSQTLALKHVEAAKFEEDLVEHVREFFPEHYHLMGDGVTRRVINYVAGRAQGYGLTTQREICLYLTVALLIGSNFDDDLLLPWAHQILTDTSNRPPRVRLDHLVDRTLSYISFIAGPKNVNLHRSFLRLAHFLRNPSALVTEPFCSNHEQHYLEKFEIIFPKKFEAIGEENVVAAYRQGLVDAANYGFCDGLGMGTYVTVVFIAGSALDRDPQLISINGLFQKPSTEDATALGAELHNRSCALLDRWLSYKQHR